MFFKKTISGYEMHCFIFFFGQIDYSFFFVREIKNVCRNNKQSDGNVLINKTHKMLLFLFSLQ